MALNALVDSFCHNQKKFGTERVKALKLQMLHYIYIIQWRCCPSVHNQFRSGSWHVSIGLVRLAELLHGYGHGRRWAVGAWHASNVRVYHQYSHKWHISTTQSSKYDQKLAFYFVGEVSTHIQITNQWHQRAGEKTVKVMDQLTSTMSSSNSTHMPWLLTMLM